MESIDLVEFDMDGSSHPLAAVFKGTQSDFHAALCDSFNTPEAMRQLLTLVTETNKFISSHIPAVRSELDRQSLVIISKIAGWITHQLRIFGLVEQGPNGPVHDVNSGSLADDRIGWNLCNSVCSLRSYLFFLLEESITGKFNRFDKLFDHEPTTQRRSLRS